MCVHLCGSQRTTYEGWFSPSTTIGLGYHISVVRFGNKCLYLLSQLTSSQTTSFVVNFQRLGLFILHLCLNVFMCAIFVLGAYKGQKGLDLLELG